MKIRNKINISFIVAFVLVVSFLGLITGIYTTNIIKDNINSYLQSSSRARAEHIRTFIKDQETTSVVLAAASVYLDFLREPENSKQYPVIKEKIDKRMARTLEADPFIYESLILNANGKIVASSNKKEEGLDKSKDPFFTQAKEGVFFKDIYFSEQINKLNYTISAPVKDSDGKLLGVSVLRYLPVNFFSIVKNENGLGDTEENFLINKERFMISPSRFLGEDSILKKQIETQNANNCFNPKEIEYIKKNGYSGFINVFGSKILEAKDYRDVDVLATHAYIPETGWCLITKVDRAEIFSYRNKLITVFSIVFLIAGFAFLLIGSFISKRITNPIKDLITGVKKVEQGDFSHEAKITTKDEVGILAESFNKMVKVVKESRLNIESKVKEQTAEIRAKAEELENQKSAILNILEDVEKEKDRTKSLANDLEKFKLALDNSSDQVVITDKEGMVVYGNKVLKQITGFSPEEAMGKKAGTLWRKPMGTDYYKEMWDRIKNQKKTFNSEIQNKRKNGELYIASISIFPVLDEQNEIIHFVAIERDVTREKDIDKAKTEFVSLASHQLRTPLSAINWYTEMLLDGDAGAINEEQKKYLNEVAVGNKRMVDLVNSLLNVSRLDLGTFIVELERVNVLEMVKSVLGELKPQIIEKKLKVEEIYDENIGEFNADKKLLRIVFQNLLSNAVKYTLSGGFVKIELLKINKGQILGGKSLEQDSLAIKISDSGIGISSNQKDKIFTKMFRADNARELETEGTGLGLYIVKSIVDSAGGSLWFESEEKKGTIFYVVFPQSGMKEKEGSKELD